MIDRLDRILQIDELLITPLEIKRNLSHNKSSDRTNSTRNNIISKNVIKTMHEYDIPLPESSVEWDQKATIVLMSYSTKRFDNIAMLLWGYQQMTGVINSIIFVWNNLDTEVHDDINHIIQQKSSLQVPTQLYNPKENLMTNRFDAARKLQTNLFAPILFLDDDVYLTEDLIQRMLQSWDECNRQCIIGLDPRYADPQTETYRYGAPPHLQNNIAIGKTLLIQNQILHQYFNNPILVGYAAPPKSACDDISLALFAVNVTGMLPTFVPGEKRSSPDTTKPQQFFVSKHNVTVAGKRYDLSEEGGLSAGKGALGWTKKRNDCVKFSIEYMGKSLVKILSKRRTILFNN